MMVRTPTRSPTMPRNGEKREPIQARAPNATRRSAEPVVESTYAPRISTSISLAPRERAAERSPPEAKCCVAAPPVLVFDASGNLLFSWGGAGAGYQWPESEHGIYVDANDFVWLAGNGKTDGQLLKFTMDGKFVLQIGKQASANDSNATDRLGSPADVAVDVAAREVYA